MMQPIICKKSDIATLVKQIQSYLTTGYVLKDIRVVDADVQTVVILSDAEITQERANDWWSGYTTGMKQALE